jgi:hypothetical protein
MEDASKPNFVDTDFDDGVKQTGVGVELLLPDGIADEEGRLRDLCTCERAAGQRKEIGCGPSDMKPGSIAGAYQERLDDVLVEGELREEILVESLPEAYLTHGNARKIFAEVGAGEKDQGAAVAIG